MPDARHDTNKYKLKSNQYCQINGTLQHNSNTITWFILKARNLIFSWGEFAVIHSKTALLILMQIYSVIKIPPLREKAAELVKIKTSPRIITNYY